MTVSQVNNSTTLQAYDKNRVKLTLSVSDFNSRNKKQKNTVSHVKALVTSLTQKF